jgi:hypothetical protein
MDFPGIDLPVVALDDLIIYKHVAWRPRDLEDVERLVAAHRGRLDAARITRTVADFSSLLDDPSRVDAWERIRRQPR